MNGINPKVNWYFEKAEKWRDEITLLRQILLGCELVEELKWGCPCYARDGNNIVLIHTFKEYCAVLFFKGALLEDPRGLLVQQTRNVQSARQMRFTSVRDLAGREAALKAFVWQAIKIEQAGLKVEMKKTADFDMPAEFQARLAESAPLREAFAALTPGRQRAYLLFFSSAKRADTRMARIDKCAPKILEGLGLNDDG